MEIKSLNIRENTIKAMNKRGIYNSEQLFYFLPRKYLDYSKPVTLNPAYSELNVAVIGKLVKYTSEKKQIQGRKMTMVKASVLQGNTFLNITWFGHYEMIFACKQCSENDVIVCGVLNYNPRYNSYQMTNPVIFSPDIERYKRIYTIYPSGASLERSIVIDMLNQAFSMHTFSDLYNGEKYGLMPEKKAIRAIHAPSSMEELRQAQKRVSIDKLIYFAASMLKSEKENQAKTSLIVKNDNLAQKMLGLLPFSLTKAQMKAYESIREKATNGSRIDALIQGDVSCGKTIVAFLSMLLLCGAGYQCVLMAPTVVLCSQHFNELSDYAEKLGIRVALYTSAAKASEKKLLEDRVKNGEYDIVIGTHGVLNLTYKNLGMVIVDEEHKFGVMQKEALREKSSAGIHMITMSATPIPLSIIKTFYSPDKQIEIINELPAGRKPVKTFAYEKSETDKVVKGVAMELKKGHQIYVVCPAITENDDGAEIASVNKLLQDYRLYFPSAKIEALTGKTAKKTQTEIIDRFCNNKTQILIATSVIEVGVTVPNATVMIIQNAERFGLASLHQLRGRVGRGSLQSYCILVSDTAKDNERLSVMTQTNDGFEIAEADLKQRGCGDLLGTDQSGQYEYISIALAHPDYYECAKIIAKEVLSEGKWSLIKKRQEMLEYVP